MNESIEELLASSAVVPDRPGSKRLVPAAQSVVVPVGRIELAIRLLAQGRLHAAKSVIKEMLAAAPAPSSLAGGEAMKSLRFIANMERDTDRLGSVMVANWIIQDLAALSPEAPALENPDEPCAPENARDWQSPEAPAREGVDVLVQNAVAASMAEDQQWTELSAPARAVLMIQICRRVTAALTPRHEAPAERAGEDDWPMSEMEVRQWILACNHEPARNVLREYIALRARSSATEARDGEAVAWRRRAPSNQQWTIFDDAKDADFYRASGRYTVEPLYAAPSADKLRSEDQ